MAQKKGKGDQAPSNEDGTAIILEYLRKQNRPYSAVDISSNLHNKVTKTYAAKALRELHHNKAIESRTAGKQTVYHALQEQDPTDNTAHDTIATLDEETKRLETRLADLKTTEKKARADLASLTSKPLLSDLRTSITRLETEKEAILARLADFHGRQSSSGSAQGTAAAVVGPEERAEVEREWKRWQRQVAVRRRICRELWDRCSEVVPEGVTREELWESLGLEGCV